MFNFAWTAEDAPYVERCSNGQTWC